MITSPRNERLKDIRRLLRSKGDRTLLEGPHLVAEALAAGVALETVLATPEFLDACDRLGMLVIDENRLTGTTDYHYDHLRRLIERDRNHPSVILWSIGNEEWALEGGDTGKRIATTMQRWVKQLDPTRLSTVAISARRQVCSATLSASPAVVKALRVTVFSLSALRRKSSKPSRSDSVIQRPVRVNATI